MDVGKLHTPLNHVGCLYYFAIDAQLPDAPRPGAVRYYYVLTTPSSSCSEAFLFLCRSFCPLDTTREPLQRWYRVYERTFARLDFHAFVGLVRESPYWDRLALCRKPALLADKKEEGCLQLFMDEAAARAGLERLHARGQGEHDVTQGTRCPTHALPSGRPASTRGPARPPSSATPEKKEDRLGDSVPPTQIISASARTALPSSARPDPVGIPTHHFDSLEDSNLPRSTAHGHHTTGALTTATARTSTIELSADGATPHDGIASPPSSIRLADLSSAGTSWPTQSEPYPLAPLPAGAVTGDWLRLLTANLQSLTEEKNERLYREIRTLHRALRTRRGTGKSRRAAHLDGPEENVSSSSSSRSASRTSEERRPYASYGADREAASRHQQSTSAASLRAELSRVQAALKRAMETLTDTQREHDLKARQWQQEMAALRNEVASLSAHSSTRLHELVKDNHREVSRIESTFAEKEAEIRHVYGYALQNRDIRLVQLSEELAVSQQREREAVGREAAATAELSQLRQRLHELVTANTQLTQELREQKQRQDEALREPSNTVSSRRTASGSGGYPGDDLLEALRGAEHRYTDSLLHRKKLETELDHLRTVVAEKDAELLRADALIQSLQDGLSAVKQELPMLRREWQREFDRSRQTAVQVQQ